MPSRFVELKQILLLAIVFLAGIVFGGVGISILKKTSDTQGAIIHAQYKAGSLTNPILDCEPYPDTQAPVYQTMEKNLESIVNNALEKNQASHVSVYYRDLNSGAWVGIQEKEEFSPASLLKVPIMMAYLKEAENESSILSQLLLYETGASNTEMSLVQNIVPTVSLKSGESYSVQELLSAMIVDSDNDAQYSLGSHASRKTLDQVYYDLGIEVPGVRKLEDFMSVKEYASFFRILYNSTYLNRQMSEKALELLSQVEYDQGLRPGVPANILIAHKFGERGIPQDDGSEVKQLHDCGIIYYPQGPYLLCVMTRGEDFDKQSKVIQAVSKEVYTLVHESHISQSAQYPLDSD